MSPISFFNRHPRADFSSYLDGELTPAVVRRLEAHTANCSMCAAELEDLRAMRTALRAGTETAAPRSFALTPEMAREARPARVIPAQPRLQPVVKSLRLASGGLAAALVVVMVIAVAGSGGNSTSDDSANFLEFSGGDSSAEYAAVPSASDALTQDGAGSGEATQTPLGVLPTPAATATLTVGGVGSGGDSGGGVGGAADPGSDGATDDSGFDAPTNLSSPVSAVIQDLNGDGVVDEADSLDADKSASGVPEDAPVREAASDDADGDGASALTIVAIVLGVLLAAALIGSIAASRLSQKTH